MSPSDDIVFRHICSDVTVAAKFFGLGICHEVHGDLLYAIDLRLQLGVFRLEFVDVVHFVFYLGLVSRACLHASAARECPLSITIARVSSRSRWSASANHGKLHRPPEERWNLTNCHSSRLDSVFGAVLRHAPLFLLRQPAIASIASSRVGCLMVGLSLYMLSAAYTVSAISVVVRFISFFI